MTARRSRLHHFEVLLTGLPLPRVVEDSLVEAWGGEAVSAEDVAFVQEAFAKSRWTIRQVMGMSPEAEPSLMVELLRRGYDLSTFQLRICKQGHDLLPPRRLSVPSQRAGYLKARWGRLAHDSTPDVVSTWQLPARRADSSYLQHYLSSAAFPRETVFKPGVQWERSLLTELQERGFDLCTFRFQVRHSAHKLTVVD